MPNQREIESLSTSKMSAIFTNEFNDLAQTIFHENYLRTKKIGGHELLEYFKKVFEDIVDERMQLEYSSNNLKNDFNNSDIEMDILESDDFEKQLNVVSYELEKANKALQNIRNRESDSKLKFCDTNRVKDGFCNNKLNFCKMQILNRISQELLCLKDMKNCFLTHFDDEIQPNSTSSEKCVCNIIVNNEKQNGKDSICVNDLKKEGAKKVLKKGLQREELQKCDNCKQNLNVTKQKLDDTEKELTRQKTISENKHDQLEECILNEARYQENIKNYILLNGTFTSDNSISDNYYCIWDFFYLSLTLI